MGIIQDASLNFDSFLLSAKQLCKLFLFHGRLLDMGGFTSPLAILHCEPRQARKGAAAAIIACAS